MLIELKKIMLTVETVSQIFIVEGKETLNYGYESSLTTPAEKTQIQFLELNWKKEGEFIAANIL